MFLCIVAKSRNILLYHAAMGKAVVIIILSLFACNEIIPVPAPDADHTDVVLAEASFEDQSAINKAPEGPHEVVLLSWFETKYVSGGNRGKNIERAMIRFAELAPGQTFSFNAAVGPRTLKNGFLKAPVIFKGEMTDGEGGGVCQVSSTLHGAARIARLDIVDRTPHSRPSSYVPLGMDSTVVWPDVDLKIRNQFPYPVVFKMFSLPSKRTWEKILRAEVWGPADPKPTPKYSFYSKKNGTFERRVRRPDGGVPDEVRKVQKGLDGQEVFSTLTWPDGTRETWKSSYPPTDEIWEVGESAAEDLNGWLPVSDAGTPDSGHDSGPTPHP